MTRSDVRKRVIHPTAYILAIVGALLLGASQPSWSVEGEKPLHPGYPLSFDGRGHFEGLSEGRIVINDVSFTLAPGAIFNQPNTLNSGPSGFRAGDIVGFMKNSNGHIESVWLLWKTRKKK